MSSPLTYVSLSSELGRINSVPRLLSISLKIIINYYAQSNIIHQINFIILLEVQWKITSDSVQPEGH